MAGESYTIEAEYWPGLIKLVEECSELQVVLAKLIGNSGITTYFDGRDLGKELIDELSDVNAAISYFLYRNNLEIDNKRVSDKFNQFMAWSGR